MNAEIEVLQSAVPQANDENKLRLRSERMTFSACNKAPADRHQRVDDKARPWYLAGSAAKLDERS